MKCDRFLELLDNFVAGELNDLEIEAMLLHLQQCPACAAECEARRKLHEELAHLDDDVHAPDTLLPDTMQRIHRERNPKRRAAWWIGGAVAAALCVTVGAVGASTLFLGLTGGAKSEAMASSGAAADDYNYKSDYFANDMVASDSYFEQAATETEMWDMPAEAPAEEPSAAPAPMEPAYDGASSGDVQRTTKTADEYGLKIIREAFVSMQTENFPDDMNALRALVEEFGGFITSIEEQGSESYHDRYNSNRWAYMTVRVPSSSLDSFLDRCDSVGIIVSSRINETDVTSQYNETDRRLQAYQKQYDRVLAMMDDAVTVDDLIRIESELSRLEMEIEAAQGSLNHWDSRVNMSTVNIEVSEVRRATPITENPTLSQRMTTALSDSWYDFVEQCKDTLVNLYASLPYFIPWAVFLLIAAPIAIVVLRAIRKNRKNRK